MQHLRKFTAPIEWSDLDYSNAVNYHHCYNAPSTVMYKGHKVMLSCGTSDSVRLFTLDNNLIEVSINSRLDYCAVSVYSFEFIGGKLVRVSKCGEYFDNSNMLPRSVRNDHRKLAKYVYEYYLAEYVI